MKSQIKFLLAVASMMAVIATGCSGNAKKAETAAEEPQTANVDVKGQWYIENIVVNDSDYVRPEEAVPGVSQYIVFEDSTYHIMTNCNSISGPYTLKGDSITFGDGAMTEMACENMATEDALRKVLFNISTIDVQNDTVVRLNGSTPAECIMLRKATTEIK